VLLFAADGDDFGAELVGFVGAYAGDGEEFGDGLRLGDGEVADDRVAEDDERGLAGFGGFGLAPCAESRFDRLLPGGEFGGNISC